MGTPPPSWDLYLASATTPGQADTLTSAVVLQPAFPQAVDPFTADSTHALYSYPAPAEGGAGVFPSLYAAPTSTGTGVELGFTNAPSVGSPSSAFATSGSKIVFTASGAFGGLDLLAADTSSSTAPTPLVNLADPDVLPHVRKGPDRLPRGATSTCRRRGSTRRRRRTRASRG